MQFPAWTFPELLLEEVVRWIFMSMKREKKCLSFCSFFRRIWEGETSRRFGCSFSTTFTFDSLFMFRDCSALFGGTFSVSFNRKSREMRSQEDLKVHLLMLDHHHEWRVHSLFSKLQKYPSVCELFSIKEQFFETHVILENVLLRTTSSSSLFLFVENDSCHSFIFFCFLLFFTCIMNSPFFFHIKNGNNNENNQIIIFPIFDRNISPISSSLHLKEQYSYQVSSSFRLRSTSSSRHLFLPFVLKRRSKVLVLFKSDPDSLKSKADSD